MSHASPLHTEPNHPSSALTNSSLWSTLLLALVLIAALLFLFNSPTLATPAQTTLSQRVQNSALTSITGTTGTYGEMLTVTMRFTVTGGTVLTGPVTLATRFNAFTPTNQLGLRFLDYQGPITVTPGTDPLSLTNFTTVTVGATTYLTWTFDTITNTSGITFVYELPYQVYFMWDKTPDTANNSVTINGAQTTLTWSPGGANNTKSANNLVLTLVKPDLGSAGNSSKAYRFIPGLAGETLAVYTVTLKNGIGTSPATNPSTAYDLALTDSLDSRLVYSDAWPLPDSVITTTPGANTVLVWQPPDWTLAPNATWVAYITATVPATAVNSIVYTNAIRPYYTTQPGLPDGAAFYTPTISASFVNGFFGSKQVAPTTNVRIGDSVTYTIRYTVTPAIYLNSPIFTDVLPLGFHYRADSFVAAGDATLIPTPTTAISGANELLRWQIGDVPAAAANRYFTFTYIADVTGLNVTGTAVYTTNLGSLQNAVNAVQVSWLDNDTVARRFTLNATTQVAQPYLNVIGVGSTGWTNGQPDEIDSQIVYTLSVRNGGTITAYDVLISDVLPSGVIYNGNLVPPAGGLWFGPNVGDSGTITFGLKTIGPGTTAQIFFNALVTNLARPGDALVNRLTLLDYSSQPGGLYDGNGNDNDFTGVYDRHYNNAVITNVLPAPAAYTFTLKGLTAVKTATPNPVQPSQLLTYSISYSNTSAVYPATNTVLIDTYGQHLIYIDSVSNPSVPAPLHDVNARTLTWNVGTLNPASANARITATFQVEAPITYSVRVLTNTIASDWDSSAPPVSRNVTTTLVQPIPTISLDDRGYVAVTASSRMTYTMIYTNAPANTGATTGTFTITLNYSPYISYTLATGRTPISATRSTVFFTDTLGPNISRTVLLQMQVVQPLPYDLYKTGFASTATIYQPDVDVFATDSEQTDVLLPQFDLVQYKVGNVYTGPGDSVTYNIYVTNTSSTITGNNIVITETWDGNATSATNPSWSVAGTYAVYTIPQLAPGATVTNLQFTVLVNTPLPPDVQLIRNMLQLRSLETTYQTSIYDTPIKGLFIQKTHTPDPVFPGAMLTYTIAYTMYGSDATSPVITDTLPAEVTYQSCAVDHMESPYLGACNRNNNVVVWSWNTLPQDVTGLVTVTVHAPASEWITLTNNYASDWGVTPHYRSGPTDLTYVGRPHMTITKQASTTVTPPAPGDGILYTLTYTNSGSYKATGTVVTDVVPLSTTFQSCGGATCSESAGMVTWNIGEVPITTTTTLTMLVRIDQNAGARTIVNSRYGLSADRNVFNENATTPVSTTIVRPALAVSKSASPTWISLTGFVTYTVRYTNTGGGLFTNLNFVDPLYATTPFQSASPNCFNASNTVSCTDANLAPGQSQQFTITVQGFGVSNNEVITNAVTYWAANQTETLPQATTLPIEVLASNAGAAADFVGTPTSGSTPFLVTFTNSSGVANGVSITSCSWNFGDGGTSTSACAPGNQVNHSYSQADVYTVILTINTDFGGHSSTRIRTNYITVSGFQVYLPLIKK